MPTPEPRNEALYALNQLLKIGGHSEVPGQLLKPIKEAQKSTVRYYKRKAKEAIDLVLKSLAPTQPHELHQIVTDPVEEVRDDLAKTLAACYENATSSQTKRQILSILAEQRTKKELLVSYKIKIFNRIFYVILKHEISFFSF